MAQQLSHLDDRLIEFISQQHLFFVATSGSQGFVNCSPKGCDSLRVIDKNQVAWLNLTGSGNETAAHVLENQRMTIMFCSFDLKPLILRLYGHADMLQPNDEKWSTYYSLFPPSVGARQIFVLNLEMVQTSCGYAVPFYQYQSERDTLNQWTEKKGERGIKEYWQQKNTVSLNNKPTGIGLKNSAN